MNNTSFLPTYVGPTAAGPLIGRNLHILYNLCETDKMPLFGVWSGPNIWDQITSIYSIIQDKSDRIFLD